MKFMKNKKALNVMGALLALSLILPLSSSAKTSSGTLTISQNILGKSLTVTKTGNLILPETTEGGAATKGTGTFNLSGSNVGGSTVTLGADLGDATWLTIDSQPSPVTLDSSGNGSVDIAVTTVPDSIKVGANEAILTLTATY